MTKQEWAGMLRRIVAFVLAAAVMVVLGSAAHSFLVQEAWSVAAGQAAGAGPASIPLADRISWAGHDLAGMIVPYASLTSIALFIAFLIAGLVARFSGVRIFVFGLAGALALFTLFTVLRMTLGSVGVFGARGSVGLAAQMAVGLAAGVLFARLTERNQRTGRS
jgi:hypothetical protein